jgi:hypothetical protein
MKQMTEPDVRGRQESVPATGYPPPALWYYRDRTGIAGTAHAPTIPNPTGVIHALP